MDDNTLNIKIGDIVLYQDEKYKVKHIRDVRHRFESKIVAKIQRGNHIIFEVPIEDLKKCD